MRASARVACARRGRESSGSIADARANALKLDWSRPMRRRSRRFLGTRVLRRLFDSPSLPATSTGRRSSPGLGADRAHIPRILNDDKYRRGGARHLFDDAQAMLTAARSRRTGSERQRRCRLLAGEQRRRRHLSSTPTTTRRSRSPRCTRCASRCARDGDKPIWRSPISSRRVGARLADYIGGFAVTAGIGEDASGASVSSGPTTTIPRSWSRRWPIAWPEAFAERLHQRVRREFWAYAPDETLTTDGPDRRKIPRHPARARLSGAAGPHREGDAVRAARRRAAIGVKLTESFAMWPGASVCGLYFSHPESHYFGVGKIERDQVEDYASAQGLDRRARRRRWLAPILNYDPLGGGTHGGRVTPRSHPPNGRHRRSCPLRCPEFAALARRIDLEVWRRP